MTRRDALKILVATGGAIAASSLIPGRWTKPVVETGVLPAHAQVSGEVVLPFLDVLAAWPEPADIDLMVWDPGEPAQTVDYSNPNGPTASHSGDNIDFDPWRLWEEVTVLEGGTAVGTYRVWVHSHESEVNVPVTVDITSHTDSQSFPVTVPPGIVNMPVAEIEFPSGAITAWAGPVTASLIIPDTK